MVVTRRRNHESTEDDHPQPHLKVIVDPNATGKPNRKEMSQRTIGKDANNRMITATGRDDCPRTDSNLEDSEHVPINRKGSQDSCQSVAKNTETFYG